jgi:5-methylcytosine-specific restriction enzyme subunit McrC
MEYVFEDFVFGFITDHWPHVNFKSQSEGYLAEREGRGVFKIKNDIYLENQLVVDTKYKIRKAEEGLKGGVSQGDLYQMIAYAIRRDCPNVMLLYPSSTDADNSDISFAIPSGELSEEISIDIRSVDISFERDEDAAALIKKRLESVNEIFELEEVVI